MGLRSLVKKGIKKLKKWQPLKTVAKAAEFVPGGKAIVGRVQGAIEAFKNRREAGQSPGDALAATAGVGVQTVEEKAKQMTMLLAVGGGILLLFLLMKKR